MVRPDTEREKELIEAFEIVLSYVKRVYSVEFDRPIGFIVRRLLACVEEEPIEVGENRLPIQKTTESSTYICDACKSEIYGIGHIWWDDTGKQRVVCKRCLRALKKKFGGDWKSDRFLFK